ncbi:MAG: hypothetical protein ACE5KG_01735, partial [Nitrososphaerales archaeon]
SIETFKDYGIDWITKKDWLNEYGLMEAVKSDTKMSEGMRVCRAFAWIDPTVLYYVGEKINFKEYECLFDPVESISFAKELIPWFDWEGIPKRILHALENGPDGSRDYFSSEILKMFSSKIVSRSWDNICFSNWRIELPDPLMLSKQYLDSEEITIGSLEDVRNLFQKTYPQLISSDAISER